MSLDNTVHGNIATSIIYTIILKHSLRELQARDPMAFKGEGRNTHRMAEDGQGTMPSLLLARFTARQCSTDKSAPSYARNRDRFARVCRVYAFTCSYAIQRQNTAHLSLSF